MRSWIEPLYATSVATLCVIPALCAAVEVTDPYKCVSQTSPEKIIRTFIDRKFIAAKPYDETDAVPSYAGNPGVTAFGSPLVAVSAWQDNTAYFSRGPGTAPPVHFLFVIKATVSDLSATLQQRGIEIGGRGSPRVLVSQFKPLRSIPLPPGFPKGDLYSEVMCYPRF